MRKNSLKKYTNGLITLTLLSYLPLVIISLFNRPSADDFNYSWRTFQAIRNNGGILELIKKAFETVSYYWYNWQGTYTSAFVFSLQPAIWGSKFYVLTGLIMIILIIGGTIRLTQFITTKLLGGTKKNGIFLGFMMSFLMIQFMPDITEGLFWFNGSMHYGLFYVLYALLICSLLRIALSDSVSPNLLIVPIILGILLEGGNQITGFMGLITLLLFIILYIIKKDRVKFFYFSSILLVMTICFLINALAPGTKVRSESGAAPGAVISIYLSIRYGLQSISSWISLPIVFTAVLCLPILWSLALDYYRKSSFRFSNPLIVVAGSIAWICAMFCPPVYAIGNSDAGRIHNLIFYFFIILFFINIFYLCGFLIRILNERQIILEAQIFGKLTATLLLVALCMCSLDSWSVEAAKDIISGNAKSYALEADMREDLCLNSKGEDVVLNSFSQIPYTLFYEDLSNNPTEWTNTAYARYYELNSVSVESN